MLLNLSKTWEMAMSGKTENVKYELGWLNVYNG
jgi:hypothetical protein